MNLKELFEAAEGGVLSYEAFESAVKEAGIKLVNLNEGNYVSKKKYEDELASKDQTITDLNKTISDRDTDLANLSKQLEEAGTDELKLTTLSNDLTNLQNKYDADVKSYEDKLKKQAYEFAVKDFANGKNFTSNAAKRDFISSMIQKELKMENSNILGAEDFVKAYSQDNADAFVVEEPKPAPASPKPTFVAPTPGGGEPASDPTGGFASAFHFTEIHPRQK